MVRIRLNKKALDMYNRFGIKPSYFPERSVMDLLLTGMEVWAEEPENCYNLRLKDTQTHQYNGVESQLMRFVVSTEDFDIIYDIDNRKVRAHE